MQKAYLFADRGPRLENSIQKQFAVSLPSTRLPLTTSPFPPTLSLLLPQQKHPQEWRKRYPGIYFRALGRSRWTGGIMVSPRRNVDSGG